MTKRDANWWIETLCLRAEIGYVFTHKDLAVRVKEVEESECENCAFHNFGKGHYCNLMKGDGVIPCSGFNNDLAKNLVFEKVSTELV